MFERRTERTLLWIVGILALILMLDRLAFAPLGGKLDRMDTEIAQLQEVLGEAPMEGDVEEVVQRIGSVRRQIDTPITERQNEFHDHLREIVGDFIVSMEAPRRAPVPQWEGKEIVSFKLTLRLTLEDLRDVFRKLDADSQPLRVGSVQITWADEIERTLNVELDVSTLGEAEEGPS